MIDHKTFDCGNIIARATPGRKRVNSGFQEMGSLHLFQVPGPGVAHSFGIKIGDETALRELRNAINFALGQVAP